MFGGSIMQVSRDNSLKIPKNIYCSDSINSIEDKVAIKESIYLADNKKVNRDDVLEYYEEQDKDLEYISKIPFNSNDLIVITKAKKLSAYVITITQKSPKKFRGVFVSRMQNYCLDAIEFLLNANFIRMDSIENKRKRENYQKEAIIKLKLLGYISMLALASNCILKKQYKQISIQLSETVSLIANWKKSDDIRWNKRN